MGASATGITALPRARTYLLLGRVSNVPTVWSNVLAAVVLASSDVSEAIPTAAVLMLSLGITLFYVGGMYLNDAFDRQIDARERPNRPIPAGLVSAQQVFVIGFGLLALGALTVPGAQVFHPIGAGAKAALWACALGGAIVLYDVWHKGNPLSPVLMGLCRALVYVTCAVSVAGTVSPQILLAAAVLLSYLVGLTFVAKQETRSRFRRFWPLLSLCAPLAYVFWMPLELIAVPFLGAWVVTVVSALNILRSGVPGSVPRAVVLLIAGISLVDAILLATAGAPREAMLAVACFGVTRLLQRVVPGT